MLHRKHMASLQAFVPNALLSEAAQPAYLTLSPDSEPMRLDSLCVSCMKNGVTTLLLTKIPFFREVRRPQRALSRRA